MPGAATRAATRAFAELPRAARIYVATVVAVGTGLLALNLTSLVSGLREQAATFLQLLALALLSSTVKVSLPLTRSGSTMSLSYAISMTALLLTGTSQAFVITVASAWSQCTFNRKVRNPLFQTLFSMASVGIALQAAAAAFSMVRGDARDFLMGVVRPLGPAVVTYFFFNSALVAGAVAASTNQRLATIWRSNFLWGAPGYFVGGIAAAVAALAAQQGNAFWGALVSVPLYLTYQSYRLFIGRIEDEQAQVRRLTEVQLATIEALTMAIEVKDQTTRDQITRFQVYCEGLARSVGMDDSEIQGLKTAALLHDIGNLAVPEDILMKPGPLTEEEFRRVKIHPRVGAEILQSVPFPYPVAPLILAHHEHWDGSGYPSGLAGEGIPLGARIIAVVDTFLALLTRRPHRPARTREVALQTLRANAGRSLDPTLVARFETILPDMEASLGSVAADSAQTDQSQLASPPRALADIADAHREAKVLHEISQAGASLLVAETLELITDKLGAVLPVSCSALFLAERDQGFFRCAHAVGTGAATVRQLVRVPRAEVAQVPSANGPHDAVLASALAVPLEFSDGALGFLAIYHSEPGAFTTAHRTVLERVAHRAAPVLFNALVFEEAQAASFTDPLTGLLNRRGIQTRVGEALARATDAQEPMALLLLDLDGLKYLNDNFGHHMGDRALRSVASAMREALGVRDLCARYAGDEFIVGLPGCGHADARGRLQHLQALVDSLTIDLGEGQSMPLAISAGTAVYPDDGDTFERLVALADQRMYADKAARKARRRTDQLPPIHRAS